MLAEDTEVMFHCLSFLSMFELSINISFLNPLSVYL